MAGAEVGERFWNEHNFVFKRGDLYYHGKGATPAWDGYAADATGLTLIPLNMSEPVLVVRGKDAAHGLGFSPHGAGRNYSRSEHKRRMGSVTPDQMLRAETEGPGYPLPCGRGRCIGIAVELQERRCGRGPDQVLRSGRDRGLYRSLWLHHGR